MRWWIRENQELGSRRTWSTAATRTLMKSIADRMKRIETAKFDNIQQVTSDLIPFLASFLPILHLSVSPSEWHWTYRVLELGVVLVRKCSFYLGMRVVHISKSPPSTSVIVRRVSSLALVLPEFLIQTLFPSLTYYQALPTSRRYTE